MSGSRVAVPIKVLTILVNISMLILLMGKYFVE